MVGVIEKLELRSALLLLMVGMLALLVPKINVISFGPYDGAGIRMEDLLIFVFLAAAASLWILRANAITQLELSFFLFSIACLISFLVNALYGRGSFLYAIRLIEYWSVFYVGVLAVRLGTARAIILALLLLNALLVVMQYFHIVGGWNNGVFMPVLVRPTGLTNGSYEVPFVIGLCSLFLFRLMRGWIPYLVSAIAVVAILMTGARIVLAAYIVAFVLSRMLAGDTRARLAAMLSGTTSAVVAVLALIVAMQFAPNLFERFDGLSDAGQIGHEIVEIYERADGERAGVTQAELASTQRTLRTDEAKSFLEGQLELSSDLSLLVRANKWLWATKSYINQGVGIYVFGMGPGSLGNALDGGVLRVLIEVGVLGLVLFALFLFRVIGLEPKAMLPVVAFFVIGNIVIDYYLASKPMMTFIFIVGIALGLQRQGLARA